jgi:EAL domain-containing protein (putative c-di-GMP-specific phosphodiesterase class I)
MEQLEALREIGFNFGQGYLFSPAVSATECGVLLSKTNLLPVHDQRVSAE